MANDVLCDIEIKVAMNELGTTGEFDEENSEVAYKDVDNLLEDFQLNEDEIQHENKQVEADC